MTNSNGLPITVSSEVTGSVAAASCDTSRDCATCKTGITEPVRPEGAAALKITALNAK